MNTTPQQILDIEDALVSDDNPARDDGTLDYERCARLHNYLVAYGWMARNGKDTPDVDALASEKWFFHDANEEVEATRERLNAPLNKFLDLVYDPRPPFFYWIDGLVMELSDEYFIDDNEMEEDKERFVLCYRTIPDLGGHNLGVVYDQQLNRASFPMTTDNMESVEPIDEHEEMWFPLETILTSLVRSNIHSRHPYPHLRIYRSLLQRHLHPLSISPFQPALSTVQTISPISAIAVHPPNGWK